MTTAARFPAEIVSYCFVVEVQLLSDLVYCTLGQLILYLAQPIKTNYFRHPLTLLLDVGASLLLLLKDNAFI